MNIFNSLGSNYNFKYVLHALSTDGQNQDRKLISFLEEKYKGKAILTYKGRAAFTLLLKMLNLPKESLIAINGFTCYTVYKSIFEAGLTPICLDLDEKTTNLNFSIKAFEKQLNENKNIKAVVVQNTLGSPCDIEQITKICNEKNIFLIEDLAHCIGTKYTNGKEAGTIGDFTTLSFSQDKIIDAISGGALIIRNKKYFKKQDHGFKNPPGQLRDRLYPLLSYLIRFFYNLNLGKPLHYILRKFDLLSKPLRKGLYATYSLPNWYCNVILTEFVKLGQQLRHRKEIAKIYAKNLNKKILQNQIVKNIDFSTNLRFPIFVEDRGELINFMKDSGIYVSDVWYDSVAPECPNAVAFSNKILNLPTHINVSKKDALKITDRINLWLKSK